MRNKLIFIFSLCFLSLGFSQENQEVPKSFSLDEAIAFALENNRTAKNAVRDIEAAKKQKWETTATGLPQINGTVNYQNNIKQQVSLLPASAFDPFNQIRQLNDFYDLSSLPVIDNIPPAPGADEFIPVVFGTKQSVNANVTLNQLIFDGSYLVGLQSAKVFLEISQNAKEKTDLQIRQAVINAYGNVLLSEESVAILERNKLTLEKNLNETRKIYENGLTEEEDVEQLEITLSSIESNLRNVKRLRDLSYKMLNITMGIDLNADTQLTDSLQSLTIENLAPSILLIEDDVTKTVDYRIAVNDTKSKELLLKLEKSKALPSLSGFITAGYNGNGNDFGFFEREQQWFGSAAFGINLNIPIFSSLQRSAATQRAKINFEKAQDDLLEVEQQLRLQVNAAKSDYQLAIEEYETAKKNLRLSERIEKKNQVKFFEGIGSSFELRQAQTQLYSAQQEYLQAMLDVINKKAALETILNQTN
ncbi:TolC family protein [Kordia algicida OT-1]|uniref:Outer membrane protein n=1 Tax=Kordia algicida OT-1 TaxID=391587 RepID=A9DN85_9FLAO|nr:TolC family protein [Kordia algicida]EDP97134.1 outer membrane protein [Kordia algicida OT-1]